MRIGNIEYDISGRWVTITMHYNNNVSESFDLKSEKDIHCLEFAIQQIKRDMGLTEKS